MCSRTPAYISIPSSRHRSVRLFSMVQISDVFRGERSAETRRDRCHDGWLCTKRLHIRELCSIPGSLAWISMRYMRELTSSSTPSPWPRIVVCHSCTSTDQLGPHAREIELTCAISGTRGSSGLGSVNIEQIDSSTIISFVLRESRG